MNPEFVTLTRQDPEFQSYLMGTFSRSHRALPVDTYHVQTERERVTFRLVPVSAVSAPPWWVIYFWSCRPELLPLTLGPAVAVCLLGHEWPSWWALAAVFFLHTAAFLYNDVQDHMRGQDRTSRFSGSQVIQRGWVTAVEMWRWSLVNALLALALAVPAFLAAPESLWWVVLGSALALAVVRASFGVRYGLVDLSILLLFGPFLTLGTSWASFGSSSVFEPALLGLALGALTLWVFQVRQWTRQFRARPEHSRSYLGFLDFDHARRAVLFEALIVVGLQLMAGIGLGLMGWTWFVLPLALLPFAMTVRLLWVSASPLASTFLQARIWAMRAHAGWLIWWLVSLGWQWL